jgi:hypothetical protein
MLVDSEDVHVTKLVDSIARIPKYLDLHLFYFSTNFYAFSKFTDLSSRAHVHFSV